MTRFQFVKNIKIAVEKSASQGVMDVLLDPPGRTPSQELLEISEWYRSQTLEEQAWVKKLVDRATRQATYNFLLVLDGLSAIDDSNPKGELELFYVRNGKQQLLNDFSDQALSSLFKDVEFEP